MHDDSAQTEQGDEVRYRHEGVHAVGDVPYQSETDYATDEDACNVEHTIGKHPFLALKVFYATFAVVAPPQSGTEGEGGKTKGKQWGSDVWYLAECLLGEGGSVMIVDVRISDDATGNDQSCEGTDDDRVPECTRR